MQHGAAQAPAGRGTGEPVTLPPPRGETAVQEKQVLGQTAGGREVGKLQALPWGGGF